MAEQKTQSMFWTEREVQRQTGMGLRLLRIMRMRGDGPPWRKVSGEIGKKGGRVIYDAAGTLAWINGRPGGGEGVAR